MFLNFKKAKHEQRVSRCLIRGQGTGLLKPVLSSDWVGKGSLLCYFSRRFFCLKNCSPSSRVSSVPPQREDTGVQNTRQLSSHSPLGVLHIVRNSEQGFIFIPDLVGCILIVIHYLPGQSTQYNYNLGKQEEGRGRESEREKNKIKSTTIAFWFPGCQHLLCFLWI